MESLLPLCPQSVGESNLFPCLCRVGILLLFEFDTLWSPLTVMLTFCPTHGNYTFFPPQWKGECQLVNVGILLLKCECQRGGSSRTVPHIVHREGEKYQWDDICSKTTWLDGTLCAHWHSCHAKTSIVLPLCVCIQDNVLHYHCWKRDSVSVWLYLYFFSILKLLQGSKLFGINLVVHWNQL